MVQGARSKVPFRRRREGKTNFRRRLNLLKSGKTRAVVRSSNKFIIVQFIEFKLEGDKVIASATSRELSKFGWQKASSNLPSAYLAGMLAAKRAKKRNVSEAVLDIGLRVPVKGSKIFAALKGMLDEGIDIPHNDEIMPSSERISGAHISEDTAKNFESVKTAIMNMEK
ncbi:MAG: 50S ribosomal protein L18 [Thermoplasmata archaeon]|nr:MAG: 50S ribosomal protein L18 [Thermoplasmata archaeon]